MHLEQPDTGIRRGQKRCLGINKTARFCKCAGSTTASTALHWPAVLSQQHEADKGCSSLAQPMLCPPFLYTVFPSSRQEMVAPRHRNANALAPAPHRLTPKPPRKSSGHKKGHATGKCCGSVTRARRLHSHCSMYADTLVTVSPARQWRGRLRTLAGLQQQALAFKKMARVWHVLLGPFSPMPDQ